MNIKEYVQELAIKKAAKMAFDEHQKEQAKDRLQAELNHNSVLFNTVYRGSSNLIKIDRSVFKKSTLERKLSNRLRSEYKKSQENERTI